MNEQVHAAVDRRAGWTWRPPRLAFPHEQEQRFIAACREARLSHFVRSGAVALFVYNLFLVSDHLMAPDVFEEAVRVRLFYFTPFAAAMLLIASLGRATMLALPPWVTEGAVVFSGLVAAYSLIHILGQSDSDVASLYRAGLVPIIVYGNLVQRFRFREAVVFVLLLLVLYVISSVWYTDPASPYRFLDLPIFLFVFSIGAYTLVVNYRIELEERRRFVRTERAAAARARLEASQRELDAQARRDPLTGVPNRRHLDGFLQQQWAGTGRAVSVLLIDVDHFKLFNDRHGHPAGDQCLRHVAQSLQRAVSPASGLVARWGGEEFMVVLPGVDVRRAQELAEALRAGVYGLALRHEAAPCQRVTISVGVASMVADGDAMALERLLAMADGALYQAKQGGRNTWRTAPGSVGQAG